MLVERENVADVLADIDVVDFVLVVVVVVVGVAVVVDVVIIVTVVVVAVVDVVLHEKLTVDLLFLAGVLAELLEDATLELLADVIMELVVGVRVGLEVDVVGDDADVDTDVVSVSVSVDTCVVDANKISYGRPGSSFMAAASSSTCGSFVRVIVSSNSGDARTRCTAPVVSTR